MLGDGQEKSAVEQKVKDLKLDDYVTFHGNVSNPQDYLEKSNLYIHSAYYEPFGLVLIEAMASGLPVISTDGKGNRDFMDGSNGVLLKDRNPETFAFEINRVLQDISTYENYKKGAFATSKKYDIKTYVDKLLDLYQTTIHEN